MKNYSYHLVFEDSNHKKVRVKLPDGYNGVYQTLSVKNGLICLLSWAQNATFQQRRQNIIKISESGEIIWKVADRLNDRTQYYGAIDPSSPYSEISVDGAKLLVTFRQGECELNKKIGNLRLIKNNWLRYYGRKPEDIRPEMPLWGPIVAFLSGMLITAYILDIF